MMSTYQKTQTTVLVVDDEFLIRASTVDLLEDAGFSTLQAANADVAIEMLETNPNVSVLFTDINMPGSLDGLELARRVHANWPKVQIILTSGRIRLQESETPPGGAFIEKPYSAADVVSLIRTIDAG